MLGWRLFWLSVVQVFGNFSSALRISLPLLIAIVFSIEISAWNIENSGHGQDSELFFGVVGPVISVLIYAFATLWTAVSWHRFLLLDERPHGALPELHRAQVIGYLGRSILIMLVVAPFSIVGMIPTWLFDTGSIPTALMFFPLLMGLLGLWVSFRICLVLPAVAVGKNISLRDAWQTSKPISGAIISLSLVTLVALIILNVIIDLMASSPGPLLGLVADGVVSWCQILVSLSILSTLYAYLVENRLLR